MAFKKVATLDTDSAVTIGGVDKKTGKKNPTSIEGYLLGTKNLGPNKFNKSKTDYMHILQTQDGNVGVWGKVHMDRQLFGVNPGTMVRITYTGTKDVGKGNPMTCFLVEVDESECIVPPTSDEDVTEGSENYSGEEEEEELEAGEEEAPADEAPPARAKPPVRAAQAPSAAAQAKVRGLLGAANRKS